MNELVFPTLSVSFEHNIFPHQISHWRGAVVDAVGWEDDFFHNHDNTEVIPTVDKLQNGSDSVLVKEKIQASPLKYNYLYRYPLIHYRVKKRKASIFAIREGTDSLKKWLFNNSGTIHMEGQSFPLRIWNMNERECVVRMTDEFKGYRIMDYQPLNKENYELWKKSDSLVSRLALLEQILAGHILGFTSSMNWRCSKRLEVQIMSIRKMYPVMTHGTKRLAFNLVYKANIDLPQEIALGKAVSHGFGVQYPTKDNDEFNK